MNTLESSGQLIRGFNRGDVQSGRIGERRIRPKRGSAPVSRQHRDGIGTSLAFCRGWSSYAFASGLSREQLPDNQTVLI